MVCRGTPDLRGIIPDRLQKARKTDPKTLSYDPATLRRYNCNGDDRIVTLDEKNANHTST